MASSPVYQPLVDHELDLKAALKAECQKPKAESQKLAGHSPATMGYPTPMPQEWDGHFCVCCGPRCDANGWLACLSTYYCSCCMFGHNQKRAFGRSAWKAGLMFFALFFLLHWAVQGVGNALLAHVGPCSPPPPEGTVLTQEQLDAQEACLGATVGVLFVYELLLLAAAVTASYYAAKNRTELRERYGIPGSRCGDFCAWLWCTPCVMCQETRTLWYNNVEEGVWKGPTPRYPAAMTAAPTPVEMGHPAEENV